MYEAYWQLAAKPFESTLDPHFYYPSEAHQGALLKLRYAIENHRQAAVLAGASGTGKTLLIHLLARNLPPGCGPLVHLVFPQMSPGELVAYAADELGAGPDASGRSGIEADVQRLRHALAEYAQRGGHPVVVVDEAHLLSGTPLLETLRLLTNFEIDGRPALTLVLVGQPTLLAALDRLPALEERLGVKSLLRPLSADEHFAYVGHRLSAAGAARHIFDPGALEAVHQLADGIPRRINRLCDLALLVAFAEEQSSITAAQIEALAGELTAVAPE